MAANGELFSGPERDGLWECCALGWGVELDTMSCSHDGFHFLSPENGTLTPPAMVDGPWFSREGLGSIRLLELPSASSGLLDGMVSADGC